MTKGIDSAIALMNDAEDISKKLASVDATEIGLAAQVLEEVGAVLDRIPTDAKTLKQYAPILALYKTKLSALKSNVEEGFKQSVQFVPSVGISIHPELANPDQLWHCAIKVKMEATIISYLSAQVTDLIQNGILNEKSIEHSTSPLEWKYRRSSNQPAKADMISLADTIQSLFAFLSVSVFVAGGDHFGTFGRKTWLPLATKILRQFGPHDCWSNLESYLLRIGLLPLDAQRKLIIAWDTYEKGNKAAEHNRVLGTIRERLLADSTHKLAETRKSPEMENSEIYYPSIVSLEAARIAAEFFDKHTDILPQMIQLFVVMRQSQFLDPRAIAPKAAGIFFADCAYLTILVAMLTKKNNPTNDPAKFKNEILLLRLTSERSMGYFLRTLNFRIAGRISHIGPATFIQGLTTQEQTDILDKTVEMGLMELSTCLNEWNSVKIDMSVLVLWMSIMIDNFVKIMNSVAITAAKAAVKTGKRQQPVNTFIWSVYRKFLNSIDLVLVKSVSEVLNSYKVATRIRVALTGNQADINTMTDPLALDVQLFGIDVESFEELLQCNPLLQNKQLSSIKAFASKLIMVPETADQTQQISKAIESNEPNYAALFNRG